MGGCADHVIEWRYETTDEIAGPTALLEGLIRRGGCDGEELAAYQFAPGEEPGARPPALESGAYAFEIEARDASCRPIGRGCTEITFPTDQESLFVTVTPLDPAEAARCAPDRCDRGRCRPP